MQVRRLHEWDVPPAEAIRQQAELAAAVRTEDNLGEVRRIAGVDTSMRGDAARAAVVVLSYPELAVVEVVKHETPITFPYIPGLLAYREAPAILAAFEKLKVAPDLVIFDGQGLAHPRRLGIACHLGLFLDLPTIGCAKSPLVGRYVEPGLESGNWTALTDKGQTVGAVVRTRTGVKPVYVSSGHRISLATAVRYVLACSRGYRLPEPCRLAHKAAGEPGA